jgi:hypothetical protein
MRHSIFLPAAMARKVLAPRVLALGVLALSAGAASADSKSTTTICLDGGGHQAAVHCKTQDASRLSNREDICICPGATRQVTAPLCPPGVRPPAESAAYEQARLKAVSNGSVEGATWRGQPMCIAPRDR